MIKVAHCLQRVHSGGVEQRRLLLVEQLDRSRFSQILICTEANPHLRSRFERANCPVYELGNIRRAIDLPRIAAARSILQKFRPDIVHGAVFEGLTVAGLAGRWAGAPIIVGEETADPQTRRWSGHLFYRALTGLTDQMVAVSPAVRDYLVDYIKVPPQKVTMIHNGVADPGSAQPETVTALRQQWDLGDGKFVIGVVGRLVDWHKRVSVALTAMKSVLMEVPDARLLIVGDGPDEAMLRQLAGDLALGDSVIFAGYQPNTRPYFELMDALAHPAGSEAFGIVLVEAMYAGLPVVASAVGGIPSIVNHGETGLLIPPERPDLLAEAILRLVRNEERRRRMGERGLARARSQFSDRRYTAEVAALYDGLLAAHRRSKLALRNGQPF